MGELFLRFPPLAGYSETQLARTREDLGYILQFLEAALLTDDSRLFLEEFLPWLTGVLTSRGLPAGVVTVGLEALGPCWTVSARSGADRAGQAGGCRSSTGRVRRPAHRPGLKRRVHRPFQRQPPGYNLDKNLYANLYRVVDS